MKKDNTLFYLLFVIAVFIIISVAKSPKKEKAEEPGDKPEPEPVPEPETDDKKTYISQGHKYKNDSAPLPSQPNSDQYDYNQEGLAGTLKKGQYTK